MKAVFIKESSQVMETPVEKSQRQSERLSESNYGKKQPSFISGYIDGEPLYATVRVLPQEVVSRIEDEITYGI
jgi:hypothetical protein